MEFKKMEKKRNRLQTDDVNSHVNNTGIIYCLKKRRN
jgi:hypothetical protein